MNGRRFRLPREPHATWWLGPRLPVGTELRTSLRNVVVTPTRFGAAFAGLLLALLLGSVNYGLSLGYLMVFWLTALWLLGAVEAAGRASGLRARFAPPQETFAGGEAAFRVTLHGPPGRARRAVEVAAGRRVAFAHLDGRGPATLTLALPAPRRGRLPLGRVRVQAHDALGLWRARRPARSDAEALVYPAPEADAPPPPLGPRAGGHGAVALPDGDEVGGLREYRPGDPLRRVSWRHAARGGALRVRELEGGASATRLTLHDARGAGDREAQLARLTAWVLALDAGAETYGLALPERELAPARGEAQRRAALSALAEHPPEGG